MADRTIIEVQGSGPDELFFKLFRSPFNLPVSDLQSFSCDPATIPPPDENIAAHGERIWQGLSQHSVVQQALMFALAAPANQIRPIYFLVGVCNAERLCWETLCDGNNRFLALDRRWPIGRIAPTNIDQPFLPYPFTPPLKILAALSAINIDAGPEWKALYDAVSRTRQLGTPIQVRVLVGQEQLNDNILEEIQQNSLTDVEVSPMPSDLTAFEKQAQSFAPHIIHFFCHGAVGFGSAELQLATFNDWSQGNEVGSLKLPISQLTTMPWLSKTWLVVFNACSTGHVQQNLHSMAHDIVGEGTVPAAIGMLEPVAASDARDFTNAFYTAALSYLTQLLASPQPNGVAEVDWSHALHAPRTKLHGSHPASREWTFPVLFARIEPLLIRVNRRQRWKSWLSGRGRRLTPDQLAAARASAETVAGALRALPPDAPDETRRQILALLDDLPPEMRPDLYGRFLR